MKDKQLRKKIEQKAGQLFRQSFLDMLRQRKFNGKMMITWRDGELSYFKLFSNIEFKLHRRDDNEMWFDEM